MYDASTLVRPTLFGLCVIDRAPRKRDPNRKVGFTPKIEPLRVSVEVNMLFQAVAVINHMCVGTHVVPLGNDQWVQQFVQAKAVQVDVGKFDVISDGLIRWASSCLGSSAIEGSSPYPAPNAP